MNIWTGELFRNCIFPIAYSADRIAYCAHYIAYSADYIAYILHTDMGYVPISQLHILHILLHCSHYSTYYFNVIIS
jgi:hypothetical protein